MPNRCIVHRLPHLNPSLYYSLSSLIPSFVFSYHLSPYHLHLFPLLIKTTLPSAKDIASIIDFIISQLDCPNLEMEDNLSILFKSLNCPFKITKSALRTTATPHAWPGFLPVLY
ncbi:hypothetical protein CDL15_Pgr010659 [Punica granatum]|uniref:Kinetochore protein NDC80 n=1 Tax=Punica granatum TaxID=22663 RepID=A0A218VSJ2_PUNGR|nr:hypothetical protein CDL15_Pgr010659 [Punica granatum]PKI39203.1 hypothetical protein CRG98_040409 [Punica granatum]